LRGDQARQGKDSNINKENSSLMFFFLTENLFVGFSELDLFFKIRGKEGKEVKSSHTLKQNLHLTVL